MILDFIRGFIAVPLVVGSLLLIVKTLYLFGPIGPPGAATLAGIFLWVPIVCFIMGFVK